jgi:hypothetical protein
MAIHDDDLRRREDLPPRDPAVRRDPVERDPIAPPGGYRTQRLGGGFSWAWLLVPLVLILLVFAFWRPGTRPADEPMVGTADEFGVTRPEGTTGVTPEGAGVGLPMTSPDEITAAEPQEIAGRSVELQNVRVEQVSSERAFWIDAGNGEQLLVVQDRTAPGVGLEPMVPEQGQTVTVSGVIREVTDADRTGWGLAAADAERATETGVYIDARHVAIDDQVDAPATRD